MKTKIIFLAAILIFLCSIGVSAQSNVITYQGRLNEGANAANGNYDFEFRLFDVASGGFPIPLQVVTRNGVTVTNGVFTVQLDFNPDQFANGVSRFLEIAVKPANSQNAYTTLLPRQPFTAVPYSIYAKSSDSAITASNSLQLGGIAPSGYVQKNTGGEISALRLENLSDDPETASTANAGRIYFNTTTKNPKISDGTTWQTLAPRRIQTFSGSTSSSTPCNNGLIHTATFTKSSAASRLKITYNAQTATATTTFSFLLGVRLFMDGTDTGQSKFISSFVFDVGIHRVYQPITIVAYLDNVSAGSHTLTTRYALNGAGGASVNCFVNDGSTPYLIEIEEIF